MQTTRARIIAIVRGFIEVQNQHTAKPYILSTTNSRQLFLTPKKPQNGTW